MFCGKCGTKINDGDSFCTNCGAKIDVKNEGINDLVHQIEKAKCVTEYNEEITIDKMDTIKFGIYPQNDISGNTKEPIEWLVLDKKGDKALLLSKFILDYKQFCEEELDIGWEDNNCSLRKWLGTNFYENAFSDLEKKRIITDPSSGYNIACLSEDECKLYLGNDEYRVYKYEKRMTRCTDYSKNIEINGYKIKSEKYWLRTRGTRKFAKYVHEDGRIETTGQYVTEGCGVRPAIWVKYNDN